MKETDDIDILRQMYATVAGGADLALTLLEKGDVWGAKKHLQHALEVAEEFYIAGMSCTDELAGRRE